MIILIILIIVLLLSLSLINKTSKKEDNILEDVKLQENTIKSDGFALMLQKEDGTYHESTNNSWPTDMVFNSELSGCIDINGNKIDNSLTYADGVITLSANKTSYCYVYFDIKTFCEDNEALSDCIVRKSDEGVEEIWNSSLEGDGYRYVGTNPNNYICFGTTDKDTCTNDTNVFMYRIIGIFGDAAGNNYAKLIKKEALNTEYAWNSYNQADVDWNESELYKGINGNYFLENSEYPYMQDAEWTDKITIWNYTMTNTKSFANSSSSSVNSLIYEYNTGKVIYLHELNRTSKSSIICYHDNGIADCDAGEWKNLSTKISLMYVSDYALSLGEVAINYISNHDYNMLNTGWMYLGNNDNSDIQSIEWTMTRIGSDGSEYYFSEASRILYGTISSGYVWDTDYARPVFYLKNNVEISGGTGTISDPFIIK